MIISLHASELGLFGDFLKHSGVEETCCDLACFPYLHSVLWGYLLHKMIMVRSLCRSADIQDIHGQSLGGAADA